jgi:uncharacterized membrane protein
MGGAMLIARSGEPILFFSAKEKTKIVQAIEAAEKKTSAEIRVHLERKAKNDVVRHATEVFERIGMAKTANRNGVLFFMGVKSKRFSVIGDEGIHQQVPIQFWQDVVDVMSQKFKSDEFAEGLIEGIRIVSEKLAHYFPYHAGDVNELPDEISYS